MARLHTTSRTIAALILLGATAAACIALGNWQLDRAAQRESIMQAIQNGRNSAPLPLTPQTPDNELVDWRTAHASGTWLHSLTVLLTNRNFNGRPGFWVATPLLLQPETHTAVLVLRGWIPRPIRPNEALPPIPEPNGMQSISGQLVSRVPRLFELWTFGGPSASALPSKLPAPGLAAPQVQNLDLRDYARITGLKLLPSVLEQTSSPPDKPGDTALGRDWPLPSIDANQNKGYALQWFAFAAIAGAAWLVVAWRALRRRKLSIPKE